MMTTPDPIPAPQPDLAAIRAKATTLQYNHGRQTGELADTLLALCDAYDTQAERLARTEQERDEAKAGWDSAAVLIVDVQADLARSEAAVRTLREALVALEGWLTRKGTHRLGCMIWKTRPDTYVVRLPTAAVEQCDCGLAQAIQDARVPLATDIPPPASEVRDGA